MYIDIPLHKEWLNKIFTFHNLRSELVKNFINDREFEFIQKVHFEKSNNIISEQQKLTGW